MADYSGCIAGFAHHEDGRDDVAVAAVGLRGGSTTTTATSGYAAVTGDAISGDGTPPSARSSPTTEYSSWLGPYHRPQPGSEYVDALICIAVGADRGHHEQGGGILEPRPSNVIQGTSHEFQFQPPEQSHHAPYPKIEFPKFNCDNPRSWRDRCEMYFEVYAVSESMKTRFVALNFTGTAAVWLQSIERRGRIQDWGQFCSLVFHKFDRNQYQIQLRQLDSLQQTGSVTEYQQRFDQLTHGTLLYNNSYDDTYLVSRFLGGLKEEIRSVIALHRPPDVDTAAALALLQEEEMENAKKKQSQKGWKLDNVVKQAYKKPDNRMLPKLTEAMDKVENLKAYRRTNGLCFKCGDKWNHNHKCPPQVPLHVLEELWDAMEPTQELSEQEQLADMAEEAVLTVDTVTPPRSRRTMKLLGHIGKTKLLILVDSGSGGTFVSQSLANQLKLPTVECELVLYKAADGGILPCRQVIPELHWYSQKHSFTSRARVLPLQCYDMILGEDWLEEMSPMWIDWRLKKMRFTHQGQRIELSGVQEDVSQCSQISSSKVRGLLKHKAATH